MAQYLFCLIVYLFFCQSISSVYSQQVIFSLFKTVQTAIEAIQQEIRSRMNARQQLDNILNQSSILAVEKLKKEANNHEEPKLERETHEYVHKY